MKRNPLRRKMDRLLGRYFLFLCIGIMKILPETMIYYFSRGIGKFAFLVLKKYRKLTIDNLTHTFKNEKSQREIKKIAQEVFCQIAWGAGEIALVAWDKNTHQRLREDIAIEGKEYLNQALSKNKGVIYVSAHFGNFPLMTSRLDLEGYDFNMLVRDVNDPVVNRLWDDMRAKIGIKAISARPRREAVKQSLKWLRSGKPLCFYADQNQTEGVYVDFLGRAAGTVEGPARLALRTGAAVICGFIIRLSRRKHKIVIMPFLDIELTNDEEKNIYEITKAFTKVIGDVVRKYPEQWWWVHDRWKGSERLKERLISQ